MNIDDPHLKCHLMCQIILHIFPHHHVVVLKLRCRRSCHNANENLRNDCSDDIQMFSRFKSLAIDVCCNMIERISHNKCGSEMVRMVALMCV